MELDSKILDGKKPLDCFTISVAKEFVGKECYFSDSLSDFARLSCFTDCPSEHRRIGTLLLVSETEVSPFYLSDLHSCLYILPCEWVKPEEHEKKYRPYSLSEWIEQHEIGDIIHYRSKYGTELRHMYLGTRHKLESRNGYVLITLGDASYSLECLFEDYEIEIDGEWVPFGVEE